MKIFNPDEPTVYDCLRQYALNAHCESTGNSWMPQERYPSITRGKNGLFYRAMISGKRYVSARYGRSERRAAYVINELQKNKIRSARLVGKMAGLADSQIQALSLSCASPVSCIIGGPGTGKTTITSVIAQSHGQVLGLSPTGKGASRLAESIQCDSYTIDRMFKQFEQGGIDLGGYDLLIVDEASMLDVFKLDMLCTAIRKAQFSGRLVFVGDSGQLPSVGPGKVLDDLCESLPTSKLFIIFRYKDADIGKACELASQGLIHNRQSANYSIKEGDLRDVWERYQAGINQCGTGDTRLITFHREDADLFNSFALSRYKGDKVPVVCRKNYYEYDIYNGFTGYKVGDYLYFNGNRIRQSSIQWSYGFAGTCHASQGGQWKRVVVWIPSARFISREWYKTAVSRPIEDLSIVVRDLAVTERCLLAAKPAASRTTLLAAFLRGDDTQWES